MPRLESAELTAITDLMEYLTENVNPVFGSPIAVDVTVVNNEGDTVGTIHRDGGDAYVLTTKGR